MDCKVIFKQVLEQMDFMHKFAQVYHKSLNLQNILIQLTPQQKENIEKTGSYFSSEKVARNLKRERESNKSLQQAVGLFVQVQKYEFEVKDFQRPKSLQFNTEYIQELRNQKTNIQEEYEEALKDKQHLSKQ